MVCQRLLTHKRVKIAVALTNAITRIPFCSNVPCARAHIEYMHGNEAMIKGAQDNIIERVAVLN